MVVPVVVGLAHLVDLVCGERNLVEKLMFEVPNPEVTRTTVEFQHKDYFESLFLKRRVNF